MSIHIGRHRPSLIKCGLTTRPSRKYDFGSRCTGFGRAITKLQSGITYCEYLPIIRWRINWISTVVIFWARKKKQFKSVRSKTKQKPRHGHSLTLRFLLQNAPLRLQIAGLASWIPNPLAVPFPRPSQWFEGWRQKIAPATRMWKWLPQDWELRDVLQHFTANLHECVTGWAVSNAVQLD